MHWSSPPVGHKDCGRRSPVSANLKQHCRIYFCCNPKHRWKYWFRLTTHLFNNITMFSRQNKSAQVFLNCVKRFGKEVQCTTFPTPLQNRTDVYCAIFQDSSFQTLSNPTSAVKECTTLFTILQPVNKSGVCSLETFCNCAEEFTLQWLDDSFTVLCSSLWCKTTGTWLLCV